MEEKSNDATPQRPEGDRVVDAPLVKINLRSFTDGMRIVLIALHKDAEMTKHTADGMISLQVLEGHLLFTTKEQSVELEKGQMLALHENVPHSVLAKEETIFLLTLTTTLAGKAPGK